MFFKELLIERQTAIRNIQEVKNAKTAEEILNLIPKLPWKRLDLLRARCQELQHFFVIKGDEEGYNNLIDIELSVIKPTRMLKIMDDPKAPKEEKINAQEYIKKWREDNWNAATQVPNPKDERSELVW